MTKTLRPIYCLALSVFLLVLMSQQADAGKHRILKVDDFRKGEVFCRGFEIKEPLTVDIYAIGSGWKSGRSLTAYGWIIRSGSLEPVWVMDSRNTDRIGRDKKLREYDSSIELEPGRYEAYFYAGTPYGSVSYSIEINNLGDIYELVIDALNKSSISKLEDLEDELEDLEDELEDLEDELEDLDEEYEHESGEMKRLLKKQSRIVEDYLLEITTDSKDFSREGCSYSSDCVIAEILEPDHDLYSSVGFSLDKPVDVKIAALGEYSDFDDVFMDHGWLLDADSRQQVWSMERRNTEPAGGADKNRMATAELQLEKGNYLLYYVTDDSHAF
ncbi:MAG: hypothetical protein KAT58_08590, partial [candidate division Zixibacteria bacterium]|nr:hypothetical protein [candidate division Zixibacteria bacterium]